MSKKARKWQECPRKPRNGRDVRESQEMAEMSKQTKKWQKHPEKSINDGNIENYSGESRNDGKNPMMSANGRSRCLQKYPDEEKLQKSQKGQRIATKFFKG
ncbi:hypothetical protein Taro_038673 [Colocasia esculenta]|uniref:Uncharacterized protein n=1 Tax=Colocasia esculenta TaxID=4460 RepID=A0A843WEJ5_COLES|nr:hypothetical protein [Colocasia esculenta]